MSFTANIDDVVGENRNGLLAKRPSWERVRLKEVATIQNGFPFESARFSKERGMPLLRIRDILPGQTETYYDGEFDDVFVVRRGDIVIGMDGDFNCTAWLGEPALLNQRVCRVTPDERRCVRQFLRYVLPGYLSAINDHTPSVTVKHLSSRTIAEIPLPLPPPREQRRIVAEIEKQFTRLEAGVAALRRVRANLKRYRAAVLKAACEGKLVPTETEIHKSDKSCRSGSGVPTLKEKQPQSRDGSATFETGEQLLQRILAERRKNWKGRGKYKEPAAPDAADLPSLPQGWAWATIEQLNLANRPCAYGVLQPGEDVENGVLFVRVGDIKDGKVDLTDLKRISPVIAAQYPRTMLHGGELAMTLVGAIGRTAIVPDALAGGNTARAVGIVPLSAELNPHWVEIWFRNPGKNAEMVSKSHEVARKTLNLEDVRAATIALPPRSEQMRVVAEAERRLSVAEELEAMVVANLRRAERLRQAILQRAFHGELAKPVQQQAAAGQEDQSN